MKRYVEVMDRLFGQEIVSESEEYFEDKLKKITLAYSQLKKTLGKK